MNDINRGFNARQTTSTKVAESFIVPDCFIEFSRFENALLIGPRGAGKTTLLKALTPSGIFCLHKREDLLSELREFSVDYLPVYIPAEKSWRGEAFAVAESVKDSNLRHHILNGLFVDHCLRYVVLALEEANEISRLMELNDSKPWTLRIDTNCEEFLSRQLSRAWKLERTQTSFLGLKLALIDRGNCYKSGFTRIDLVEKVRDLPSLDILEMFRAVIEIVQSKFGYRQWCFSLDEMEIAPKVVVSMLYENLRSWDHRAVLKFSLFPYADFRDLVNFENPVDITKSPVEGQDYVTFVLADSFTKSPSQFVQKLVEKECEKRGTTIFELARYLNHSKANKSRRFNGLNYERDMERIFHQSFYDNPDSGFKEWLKEKGFEKVEDLIEVTGENERARTVRKIAPIVEFRSYYLSHSRGKDGSQSGAISHKGFGYYHGYNQIIDLTEGNPRALKFYINSLLDAMQNNESSITAQNRVIKENVDRFRALCASQVVPYCISSTDSETTLGFIDKLGLIFRGQILGEKLKTTSQLSCEFKNLTPQIRVVIEVAVNAGALILDHSNNLGKLIFDVEGKRMRLSHRFSPFFPLPTITGGTMRIDPTIWKAQSPATIQSDLFGWLDND